MKHSRWVLAVLVAGLAACAAEPARPVAAQHESEKPQAPVTMKIDHADKGGGRYEVKLVATPSASVKSAQLRLILPAGVTSEEEDKPAAFGPTSAGKPLQLVRHLRLTVPGADVVVDVRTDDGVHQRNRAEIIRLGAAKPTEAPAHTNTVILPNGDKVEEVRQ